MRSIVVFLLSVVIINSTQCQFCADAFLDATLLLDRLKQHYWLSPSWKITSCASSLSRHSSMAYIEQLHKKRGRRKSSHLASKDISKQKPEMNTSKAISRRSEILFQQRLSELRDFIDENGHGSIPTPYEDNPPLGVWAANLRRQFVILEHAQEDSTTYEGYLTQERLDVLKQSGFDFTSLTERQFKIRLEELKQFKEKYGHTLVPEKHEENIALGAWVSNMRTQYKKQRSKPESTKDDAKIDDDSGLIKKRYSKNMLEHESLPTKKRRKRQRSKRNSQLDDEKERLLEEVGFVWNAIDRKWFVMLEWCKVYAVVNYELALSRDGNSSISLDFEDGCFNKTTLDERDTVLLDNYYTFVRNIQDPSLLPYFHPQDEILDLLLDKSYVKSVLESTQRMKNLVPYSKRQQESNHDACPALDYRVPKNDALHYSLRIWMVNQRSNYHRRFQKAVDTTSIPSTMTDRRQRALEEINFPWSGRFANRCEEMKYEIEREKKNRIEMEKKKRMEMKLQREHEKIAQLKKRQDSVPLACLTPAGAEEDILSLWNSIEDEEDEEDWI